MSTRACVKSDLEKEWVVSMSVADQIKARLDIVDIISHYTTVKKAGRNYKSLCPFHSEKTPSFVIFPDSQTWRCFGQCGEGGDLFSFVMKAEGWDFSEALRELAQKAGVELEAPTNPAREQAENRLYTLLTETVRFFQEMLPGSDAEAYIRRRGLNDQTVGEFGLGYAPDEWTASLHHLSGQGFTEEEIIAAGVALRNENGNVYDRFRGRFIIPIRDGRGRTVGFGARALFDNQNPKYLNSPQTELFDKSEMLYGFDVARRAIRESETAIIVEGYMDVLQAHQAGYRNVVATMGTALTPQHIQNLGKYAGRLVLALDADLAGIKATMRGLEVAREALGDGSAYVMDAQGVLQQAGRLHLDIRILELPHGKDPDDFIRNSPGEWGQVVAKALPLSEYLILGAAASLPEHASVIERQKVAQELLPLLLATEDKAEQLNNLQLLSLKLRLDSREMVVWAKSLERVSTPPPLPTKHGSNKKGAERKPTLIPPPPSEVIGRTRKIEQFCLSVLLKQPNRLFEANRLLREMDGTPLGSQDFVETHFQAIFTLLQIACRQDEQDPLDCVWDQADVMLRPTLEDILMEPLEAYTRRERKMNVTEMNAFQQEKARHAPSTLDEFPRRLLELRRDRLGREITQLHFVILEAHEDRDPELEWQYAQQADIVQKKLRLFNNAINNLLQANILEN
jgi:DNA primase